MRFLSNLSIRKKFLLLPTIAAGLMLVLGVIFMSTEKTQQTLLHQTVSQDVPKMRAMARLFSEFSTNHAKFISLLASSLQERVHEAEVYTLGRENITVVNRLIEGMASFDKKFEFPAEQRQIADRLRQRLLDYRHKLGSTVFLASVDVGKITQFTLTANEAYNAANDEFLLFIDAVQESAQSGVASVQATSNSNKLWFITILGATILFVVLSSALLSSLLTLDLKSVITVLAQLARGDTDVPEQPSQRGDEFGAVNQAIQTFKQALIRRDEAEGHLKVEIAERKRAEEHLRAIISATPECVKLTDADDRLIEMNTAGLAMIEADSMDQVIHMPVSDLLLPEHREAYQALNKSVRQGNKGTLVFEIQGLKGARRWMETHAAPMTLRAGETVVLAITRDITERKRAEAELLQFKHVLDNTLDMVFMFEPESLRFVYLNQGAVLSMGYSEKELLGMTPSQITPLIPEPEFRQLIAPLLSGEQPSLRFDTLHRRKDGTDFSVAVFLQLVTQSDGSRLFVAIVHDNTERKKSEELIWQQANFDTLTGLPNRRMFHDRLEQEIKKSHRSGVPMALMLLDLDHFKEVNDTLGHPQGDILLVEAARRIAECVRESDTVARLGGDEFTIILSEMAEINSVERLERARNLGDFVGARLLRARHLHQLQVIYHHHADVVLALQAPRARAQIAGRQRGRVVYEDRGLIEDVHG